MPPITRSQQEIDDVLNRASESKENGTAWPGESYEAGVENALLWVTGQSSDNPMED